MALRGNLKDFSLPDVFQLVQLSRKTGVLRIAGAEGEGSIWFREGEVFFAQSDWRTDRFGERLVNAQRITPAALERALEIQTAEAPHGRRLGEILVAEGYITRQVLEAFVLDQIQDTIFDLMRWDEGRFDFEVLPEVLHEDIGLAVSVENIVMEGSRRLEEWQRVRKKVPSMDMVFKMATAPGEGTFEISLKPAEWSLLLLVDGTRSVHDLALETHAGDFDVARMVYGLFSAGLLEVVDDAEVAERRAERERRDAGRVAACGVIAESVAGVPDEFVDEPGGEPGGTESAIGLDSQGEADMEHAQDGPVTPDELPTPGESLSAGEPPAPEQSLGLGEAPTLEEPLAPEEWTEEWTEEIDAHEEPLLAAEPEALAADVPEVSIMAESIGMDEERCAVTPESAEDLPGADDTPSPEAAEGIDPVLVESPDATAAPVVTLYGFEPPDVSVVHEFEAPAGDVEMVSADATRVWTWETPAPTGDLTRDLMALGLGEYPEELLLRVDESAPVCEDEIVAEDASPLVEESVAGPVDIIYSFEEAPVTRTPDPLVQVLGRPEAPAVAAADGRMSIISTAPFVGDASSSEDQADTGREPGVSSGAEEAPYVSTDAFLADLDGSVSFSGGLGDELAALTGAGPSRARPQGAPAARPQREARPALRRDHAVDRTLLIRIIEGIERL